LKSIKQQNGGFIKISASPKKAALKENQKLARQGQIGHPEKH
jgi:hypothetical protein